MVRAIDGLIRVCALVSYPRGRAIHETSRCCGDVFSLLSLLEFQRRYPLIPCGIPYIFGTVGKPENNLISDSVMQNNNIELLVDEAKELNRTEKKSDPGERRIGII